MKRQRGRNRGGGGGNKPQQQNANRAFDSNGPEGVKVRGAAQGVFEKYQQLARDASSAGDRVLAENYLQHAEHYFRTLRAMQPHRPVSDIVGREQFASGFDIDFEAEPEEAPEQPEAAEATEGADNSDGQREARDGQRQDGRRDRFENRRDRDDRPREDRPRDERPREERAPRDERPRDDRPREDRPEGGRRDRWRERDERRERQERAAEAPRDPMAVIEPQAAPLTAESPSEDSPRLRGQDGAVSELPAFLGRPAQAEPRSEEAPAAEAKKPRRRRAPRSFEGGEGAPAETEEA
jgi:hypothetical protein